MFVFIRSVTSLLTRLSVCRSVAWSFGRSVCHDFQKGREITLRCSSRNTCLSSTLIILRAEIKKNFTLANYIYECYCNLIRAQFWPAWLLIMNV